jgi:tetratricopeptide (TPR) repeat protein
LYPIVAYCYSGALDHVRQLEGPLLEFFETGTPNFPPLLLTYAVLAHIRAGELETGKNFLEKCTSHTIVEHNILPLIPNIFQAKAELALAEGKFEQALSQVETFLEQAHGMGVYGYDPPKLLLKGRILHGSGQFDEAYSIYKQAKSVAEEQNARPELWQICAQLAEMEAERGDLKLAQSLKEQARGVIGFISDHAGRDDFRAAFVAMPEVQRVLEN